MNFKLTKSSLNFKVYTSPTIPASGTENDIVIISSTPMENWILSSDSPAGEPRNNGDVWIQYSVSGNVFDIMNQHDFMLAITKIYQYISGIWMTVNARRYVGGVWDVVSSAFSATISITYPANSNCVVTNAGGQTVASDTNTGTSAKTWTATVNATGTYTVTATATDGSGNTKSESVEITSEGQSESVDLHYIFYIFKSGVGAKVELQTFEQANANVTIGTDSIKITRSDTGNNYSNIQTKELMPSALWNTIKIDVILTKVSSYENVNAFGLAKSALSSQGDFDWVVYTTLADKAGTERVVLSCDIAAINADYIFGIGGSFNMEIFNIWLE